MIPLLKVRKPRERKNILRPFPSHKSYFGNPASKEVEIPIKYPIDMPLQVNVKRYVTFLDNGFPLWRLCIQNFSAHSCFVPHCICDLDCVLTWSVEMYEYVCWGLRHMSSLQDKSSHNTHKKKSRIAATHIMRMTPSQHGDKSNPFVSSGRILVWNTTSKKNAGM